MYFIISPRSVSGVPERKSGGAGLLIGASDFQKEKFGRSSLVDFPRMRRMFSEKKENAVSGIFCRLTLLPEALFALISISGDGLYPLKHGPNQSPDPTPLSYPFLRPSLVFGVVHL